VDCKPFSCSHLCFVTGDEADHTEKMAVGDRLRLRCNSVANISWHKDGAVLRTRVPQLRITKQA